jgi:hypothetical protein
MGCGGIASAVLTSTLDGGGWSASRPWPLYPQGKVIRYPLDRRLDWAHNWFERCGEEKNFLLLPGIETRPSSL